MPFFDQSNDITVNKTHLVKKAAMPCAVASSGLLHSAGCSIILLACLMSVGMFSWAAIDVRRRAYEGR